MLKSMRRNVKSLKPVLWLIVITFVAAIFTIWGGAGRLGEENRSDTLATIGGDRIASDEYYQALRVRLESIQKQFGGELNANLIQQLGVPQQTLEQLVQQRLLVKIAKDMGLRATDAEVRAKIVAYPAFQQDGRFVGFEDYKRVLDYNHIPLAEFENGLRQDVVIGKVVRVLTAGLFVTDEEVWDGYRKQNDTAKIEYLVAETAKVEIAEKPSEAELRARFDKERLELQDPREKDGRLRRPEDRGPQERGHGQGRRDREVLPGQSGPVPGARQGPGQPDLAALHGRRQGRRPGGGPRRPEEGRRRRGLRRPGPGALQGRQGRHGRRLGPVRLEVPHGGGDRGGRQSRQGRRLGRRRDRDGGGRVQGHREGPGRGQAPGRGRRHDQEPAHGREGPGPGRPRGSSAWRSWPARKRASTSRPRRKGSSRPRPARSRGAIPWATSTRPAPSARPSSASRRRRSPPPSSPTPAKPWPSSRPSSRSGRPRSRRSGPRWRRTRSRR